MRVLSGVQPSGKQHIEVTRDIARDTLKRVRKAVGVGGKA